jgi:membrane protein required for colicin V production
MPITVLDVLLLVVMLISGMLAMIRGFMREILSIGAWAVAAFATLYAYPRVLPMVKQYISSDIVAAGAAVAGVFLLTLLVVSVITIRISDMVLDSRVGALDRTLGFLFGLGRGLIIVVVAFLFFAWLVPDRSQPEWVRGAKSKVVLQSTGQWLMSMLPDDPESTILKRLKKPKPEDQDAPPDAAPGQRSQGPSPVMQALANPATAREPCLTRSLSRSMRPNVMRVKRAVEGFDEMVAKPGTSMVTSPSTVSCMASRSSGPTAKCLWACVNIWCCCASFSTALAPLLCL